MVKYAFKHAITLVTVFFFYFQAILDENRMVEHYIENHNAAATVTATDNRCFYTSFLFLDSFFCGCAFYTPKNFTSACERYKSYQMLRWEYCSTKQLKNESLFVSTHKEKEKEIEREKECGGSGVQNFL